MGGVYKGGVAASTGKLQVGMHIHRINGNDVWADGRQVLGKEGCVDLMKKVCAHSKEHLRSLPTVRRVPFYVFDAVRTTFVQRQHDKGYSRVYGCHSGCWVLSTVLSNVCGRCIGGVVWPRVCPLTWWWWLSGENCRWSACRCVGGWCRCVCYLCVGGVVYPMCLSTSMVVSVCVSVVTCVSVCVCVYVLGAGSTTR